jgi:glycosyltransferase involved in cell wall biosynthesis
MKKGFIIIPAYNEEENLLKLLKRIPSLPDIELQILVIDDGSTDNTTFIAKEKGALVLSNRFNLGWRWSVFSKPDSTPYKPTN